MAINNGSSTNNGGQQVSIYPFQALKSVLGNEIIHGLFDEGVFNATVNVSDSGSNINFNIGSGTTLMFKRTYSGQTFIGKTVLTSLATITLSKTQLWTTGSGSGGNYYNSNKLYIVADWSYDVADPTTIYVVFSLEYDNGTPGIGGSIGPIRAYDGTTNHKLIVATILNNAGATTLYVANNANVLYIPNTNVSSLHISYDIQRNRNVIKREEAQNNSFTIDFNGVGTSVTVNIGKSFISGSFNYLPSSISISPPAALATYLTSKTTGIVATTGSLTANNWVQVDVLRLKKPENVSATASMVWESSLFPLTLVSPYIAGWPQPPLNYNDILTFLSGIEMPLVGHGKTLLISVRNFASVQALSLIWPENCIIFNEQIYLDGSNSTQADPVFVQDTVKYHDRFKVPVYQSSDLGY